MDGMGQETGESFKREGIYVYLWLIHVEVCQKTAKFLEKEMATHSSILAWKIPWTEEPGGL